MPFAFAGNLNHFAKQNPATQFAKHAANNGTQDGERFKKKAMKTNIFLDEATAPTNAKPANGPDTDAFLTDEQLADQGMVKITAFVRTEKSIAALRKQKQREKELAGGLKQLNVKAPAEVHDKIKAIATECTNGKSLDEAIKAVTSHKIVTTGWKKLLLQILNKICRMLES